jgi:hypothetical protein
LPGLALVIDLHTSTAQVAGITGTCHCVQFVYKTESH